MKSLRTRYIESEKHRSSQSTLYPFSVFLPSLFSSTVHIASQNALSPSACLLLFLAVLTTCPEAKGGAKGGGGGHSGGGAAATPSNVKPPGGHPPPVGSVVWATNLPPSMVTAQSTAKGPHTNTPRSRNLTVDQQFSRPSPQVSSQEQALLFLGFTVLHRSFRHLPLRLRHPLQHLLLRLHRTVMTRAVTNVSHASIGVRSST